MHDLLSCFAGSKLVLMCCSGMRCIEAGFEESTISGMLALLKWKVFPTNAATILQLKRRHNPYSINKLI